MTTVTDGDHSHLPDDRIVAAAKAQLLLAGVLVLACVVCTSVLAGLHALGLIPTP